MPALKTKPDADKLYACHEPFAGVGFSARFGQLFPGSHEFVQRWPDRFTPDGELLEQPDPRRQATPYEAEHYAEHVERTKTAPLATADVVECIEEFSLLDAPDAGDVRRLGLSEIRIPKGARFHRWSPVLQIPGLDAKFQPVLK